MKPKQYILLLLLFIEFLPVSGQPDAYQYMPPTPEAVALGKFIEAPVNGHTGIPDINIPLYTVTEGDLVLPITLRYHASGIKAGESASWVGTGWALEAGGMISRAVNGIADDEPGGYLSVAQEVSLTDLQFIEEVQNGLKDSEQDIFSFSFPGYRGKFFFDQFQTPHIVPRQALKIEVNGLDDFSQISVPITQFTIITPDGTRYFFGLYNENGLTLNGIEESCVQSGAEMCDFVQSTWRLVRVESHDGNYAINLFYINENYAYKLKPSREQFTGTISYATGSSTFREGPSSNTYNLMHVEGKRLNQITSSFDQIDFDAFTNRQDLSPDLKRLDAINIKTGTFHKKWNFQYSYFKDHTQPDSYENKRLKLDGIQLVSADGIDQINPYKFDYIKDQSGNYFLPQKLTNAVDYWGHYNGQTSNDNFDLNIPSMSMLNMQCTSCGSNRNSNDAMMQIGTLSKIEFPHGGATYFTYEANRYKPKIINPILPPLAEATAINFGPTIESCPTPDQVNVCCDQKTSTPHPQLSFTAEEIQTGLARFQLIKYLDNRDGCGLPIQNATLFFIIREENAFLGNPVVYVNGFNINQEINNAENDPNHPPGQAVEKTVDFSFEEMGLQANINYIFEVTTNDVFARLTFHKLTYPTNTTDGQFIVGGLRVKEIRVSETNSPNSHSTDIIKTYEYSEGTLFEEYPVFSVPITEVFTCNNNCNPISLPSQVNVSGAIFLDTPFNPLADISGYHIGYERVTELHNGNGKKIMLFDIENSPSYETSFPGYHPPAILVDNGNLKESIILNSADEIIQKTINTKKQELYLNPTGLIFKSKLLNVPLSNGQAQNNYVHHFKLNYKNRTKYYRIANVNSIQDGVSTSISYSFDSDLNHPYVKEERMTNSDGKETRRVYKYTYNFPDAVYSEMYSRNRLSLVEQLIFVDNNLVDGSRTNFSFFDAQGNPEGSGNSSSPIYTHSIERDERTWANGILSGENWNVLTTFEKYDISQGKPIRIRQRGWNPEIYTWQNGLLISRKYCGSYYFGASDCSNGDFFEWSYEYQPNTRLLNKTTDIDGQFVMYQYDGLLRLKNIIERNGNVSTTHEYAFASLNNSANNFIKTIINFTPTDGSGLHEQESIQYLDGLGRPIQTVQKEYSSNNLDVIHTIKYDNQGRQWQIYEPFESGNSDGSYVSSNGSTPYTEKIYEASPLNRLSEVYPPDWNYPTTFNYGKNETNITSNTTSYPIASLNTTIITDGNGNSTTRYTNKKGRMVFETRPENTFLQYKYDDKDRLESILPPGATIYTPNLQYSYTYDGADNILTEKFPGKDHPSTYVYDDRNLPTYRQDANMKEQNRWLQTLYDTYGRVIQTGFNNNINGIPSIPIPFNEILSETNYYNSTDPLITRGKVKEQFNKILGTSNWLKTYSEYDAYGRLTKLYSNNHLNINAYDSNNELNCAEVTTLKYDFADNQLLEQRIHRSIGEVTYIATAKDYDDEGRLTNIYFNIDDSPVKANKKIVNYRYTEKDQLLQRNIGQINADNYLQHIDYSYNAQRWLTKINGLNVTAFSDGVSGSDLLKMEFFYDNPNNLQAYQIPAYNGNIAQIKWQVQNGIIKTYGYEYDNLDRLKKATYFEDDFGVWSFPNGVSTYQTSYTYDPLGNIQTLQRNGLYIDGNNELSGSIDDLSYSYSQGSNRVHSITDQTFNTAAKVEGFNPGNGTGTYSYDFNGNLTSDPYKDLTIYYNHLNLPYRAEKDASQFIEWLYDASGRKLQKVVSENSSTLQLNDHPIASGTYQAAIITSLGSIVINSAVTFQALQSIELKPGFEAEYTAQFTGEIVGNISSNQMVRNYINGIEYLNGQIEAIYHPEGRVYLSNDQLRYEYYIRDHLENTRFVITEDGPDQDTEPDILQENHYYPFGLTMNGNWISEGNNQYLYNGKEFNTELGLNWLNFGFRDYDPTIGRFTGIDPIADQFAFASPYNYAENEPVRHIDLHGLQKFDLMGHFDVVRQQSFQVGGDKQVQTDRESFYNGYDKGLMLGAVLAGGGILIGEIGPYFLLNPEMAPAAGGFMMGLGTDENIPGWGDDLSKGLRHGSKALLEIASSNHGQDVRDFAVKRIIENGEKIEDLINEIKIETFREGIEHAVVKLANGNRAIVSGGKHGIRFPNGTDDVEIIFGHTHPTIAPPSQSDFDVLNRLDQSQQTIFHGGQKTKIRRDGSSSSDANY